MGYGISEGVVPIPRQIPEYKLRYTIHYDEF
jgi:hypothetical protein